MAKFCTKNEHDANAIKWITDDESRCIRTVNELRSVDAQKTLKEESAQWRQLWGKTGCQKPEEEVLCKMLTDLGFQQEKVNKEIKIDGWQLQKSAKEKHRSPARPDGWAMGKVSLLPKERFNYLVEHCNMILSGQRSVPMAWKEARVRFFPKNDGIMRP